jgi:hypothetical protein
MLTVFIFCNLATSSPFCRRGVNCLVSNYITKPFLIEPVDSLTKCSIMKTAGIVILVIGIIGLIVFGIQALQDSDSFSLLGIDIAVSKANWTPVIISAIVTVVGIVMVSSKK